MLKFDILFVILTNNPHLFLLKLAEQNMASQNNASTIGYPIDQVPWVNQRYYEEGEY